MPVIKLQHAAEQYEAGTCIVLLCTDPGVIHDVPAWCRVHGHEVVSIEQMPAQITISVMLNP